MEWYGSQNLSSREVADYIDSFSNKQNLKRFYRLLDHWPYNNRTNMYIKNP